MKNKLITALRSIGSYNGELWFDDYKLSFSNDPSGIAIGIIGFGFLCFSSGLSMINHFSTDGTFHSTMEVLTFVLTLAYLTLLIFKYPKAKRMHQIEFTPSDIEEVYLLQTKNRIEFTFDLKNGGQQKFKTRKTHKSEKLISFLTQSGVDILIH